jgi:hypothetical protein
MNLSTEFSKIFKQYEGLNKDYTAKETLAFSKGQVKAYGHWKDRRQLNDAIHFLFMFSRFEDFIRTKSNELILRKASMSGTYSKKSGWLILKDYDRDDNLHLMKRVQLFIDKGDARFAKIKEYYETRNSLAHGGMYNTPIDVNTAKQKLLEFSSLFIL